MSEKSTKLCVEVPLTKGIAVANLCSPASDQVNLILGRVGHLGVKLSRELDILVYLVRLDFVEHDGVDVFASFVP
jgi:hypothetical protein